MYSLVLCCFSTALQRPAWPPTGFCRRPYAEHTAERGIEAEIDSLDDTLAIWMMMRCARAVEWFAALCSCRGGECGRSDVVDWLSAGRRVRGWDADG